MGRPAVDMTGLVFGRLTVLGRGTRTNSGGHAYWTCLCSCGKTFEASGGNLRRGSHKSCGCLRADNMRWIQNRGQGWKNGHYKHGHTVNHEPSPTWISWYGMRKRCNDLNNPYYGGRGVTYDPRWDSFEVFVQDMGLRPAGKTLDRIDPYGNYEPGNVRWATAMEQAHNKRSKAS